MQFKNIVKNTEDQNNLREATRISSKILFTLKDNCKIGISPKELNDIGEELAKQNGVELAFKGNKGPKTPFPAGFCISVNDETLHTIPYSLTKFESGDIVKIDFGIKHKGFYTDHCITVGLGELTKDEERLISTAKLCVETAVKQAIVGNKIGDISYALQSVSEMAGFNYVKNYMGHGIGRVQDGFWQEPGIPAYGYPNTGLKLIEGMVLCIENQISLGSAKLNLDADGWTLRTSDGSKSAMFEQMVIVRKGKPEILTQI